MQAASLALMDLLDIRNMTSSASLCFIMYNFLFRDGRIWEAFNEIPECFDEEHKWEVLDNWRTYEAIPRPYLLGSLKRTFTRDGSMETDGLDGAGRIDDWVDDVEGLPLPKCNDAIYHMSTEQLEMLFEGIRTKMA